MTNTPRPAHSGQRAIRTETSFSSLSTAVAELDFTTNQPIKPFDQRNEKLPIQTKGWGLEDELSSCPRRENARGLDDEAIADSRSPGVEKPTYIAERDAYIPNAEHWRIGLSQILEFGPANTARKLAEASFGRFAKLPFYEFVQRAGGNHSEIIYDYIWSYNLLGEKLYFDFAKAPSHLDQLFRVKEGLEEVEADPFIKTTVEYACTKAVFLALPKPQSKPWEELKAGYLSSKLGNILHKLVIEPLKHIFNQPCSGLKIQQDLKIVEARFHRNFMPLNVHWHSPLQVSTQFADEIRCRDSWTLAEILTRNDKILFETYIGAAIEKDGGQARSILNARWNQLMVDVSECLTARIGLEAIIDGLAHNLYRLRNFYSLAAIIHGIPETGLRMESLEMYSQLFNPASNYQVYRNGMGTGRALHFLLPTFLALRIHDKRYAAIALKASAYDINFKTLCPLEPGRYGKSSQLDETSSTGYSLFNVFSMCFKLNSCLGYTRS